MQRYSTSDK